MNRAGFSRWLSLAVVGLGILWPFDRGHAIEEAEYTVLFKEKNFELRQYKARLLAETIVEGDFSEVGNEGFRRLFKFISGENRGRQSIPMTAPVGQDVESEQIAMTAPVQQQGDSGKWRISFLMPSEFTMETVPEPTDVRIQIREAPGGLVAAIRYSGTWSRKRYEEKKTLLDAFIRKQGLKQSGEAIFARYNPPFTPWFLRRNEVLIAVERMKDS
jgi:hypothetical protein